MEHNKIVKTAIKRICICHSDSNTSDIVYLSETTDEHPELGTLSMFYCTKCNSYWHEP